MAGARAFRFLINSLERSSFLWTATCNDKRQSPLLPNTKTACKFITSLKEEIQKAVCQDKKESYHALWRLVSHYQGYVFSETQSLYLEHRAKALGLNLGFHQRVKKIINLSQDRAHEPQKRRQIKALLTKKQYAAAREQINSFSTLCSH